ncbi:MAG: sigma-70 family RNA polymerase sigma factor [Candidatus Aenigmatarchaeota archaeon]
MPSKYDYEFPPFMKSALSKSDLPQEYEQQLLAAIGEARHDVMKEFAAAYRGTPLYEAALGPGNERPIFRIEKMMPVLRDAPEALRDAYARLRSARNELVLGYLKLALKCAKHYAGDSDLEDMFQVCVEGLLRAATAFDGSKGCKFMTYAVYWIQQRARRARHDDRLIRAPYYHATPGAVRDSLREKSAMAMRVLSLSATGDDDDRDRYELLAAADEGVPLKAEEDRDMVQHLLSRSGLTARERDIVQRRYMSCGDRVSLEDVGKAFGITKERTRQIERRAFRKMARTGSAARTL